MTFNKDAWQHAKAVIQSEGYAVWLRWQMENTDQDWLNGLAAAITHKVETDRADVGQVEYRDGTVERIR